MTTDPADAPLDDLDQALLDGLARIDDTLDPPPADLLDRVRFAIDLEDLDVEVARAAGAVVVGAGSRADEVRTLTFEAGTRSLMLTLTERRDGLVRLDGWVAPAAALLVELRAADPDGARQVRCDPQGRFALDGLPRGLVQLVVRPQPAGSPGTPGGGGRSVVTPGFEV
jgi:hypothetical protein